MRLTTVLDTDYDLDNGECTFGVRWGMLVTYKIKISANPFSTTFYNTRRINRTTYLACIIHVELTHAIYT